MAWVEGCPPPPLSRERVVLYQGGNGVQSASLCKEPGGHAHCTFERACRTHTVPRYTTNQIESGETGCGGRAQCSLGKARHPVGLGVCHYWVCAVAQCGRPCCAPLSSACLACPVSVPWTRGVPWQPSLLSRYISPTPGYPSPHLCTY